MRSRQVPYLPALQAATPCNARSYTRAARRPTHGGRAQRHHGPNAPPAHRRPAMQTQPSRSSQPGRPVGVRALVFPRPSSLRVTHGERVIDEATGVTKRELLDYYAAAGPVMTAHLRGRPVALVRAPAGIGGEVFFQKHEEDRGLPAVIRLDPALDPGHAPLLEIANVQGLLAAAQFNVVEFHTWNARKDRIERPDRLTFDLDPGQGVAWEQVQDAATLVHALLGELGLPAFLKTSGGKGLHLVVPIKRTHGWDEAKAFSAAVVRHLARTVPQRFVAKSGPRNRVGKVYVDYLRNGRGATTAAAWTARARPGLGVSVPVDWTELDGLTGGAHWTVPTVHDRLRVGNAPWRDYTRAAVAIGPAVKLLGDP